MKTVGPAPIALNVAILKRGEIPGKTVSTVEKCFTASLAPTDTFTERRITYSTDSKGQNGAQLPFWLTPSEAPGYDAFMRGVFENDNGRWIEHGCTITRGS